MGEKIDKNENVGQDLKDLFEIMKFEFENFCDVVVGVKLELDEKFQEIIEIISIKIDDKIVEVIVKYEEFQVGFDEKIIVGEV